MTDLKLDANFAEPSQADWLAAVESALKGKPVDTLNSTDLAGFSRQPLYHESHSATAGDEAGLPGFTPFTRGAQAVNNKFLPWHIAQRAVIGRANADNAAIRNDLEGGVSAITLDFSENTLDADALDELLDGVMLDIAPLNIVPGKNGMNAIEPILDLFERRALTADAVGFLNADPLAAKAQYDDGGEIDYHALSELTSTRPGMRLMTSSGAAYHALGASVPQELGWMLAGLTAYISALETAGMDAAMTRCRKSRMTVAADVDFFTTLAKIRAASLRKLANIAEADRRSRIRRSANSCRNKSLRAFSDVDPWVNILRATAARYGCGDCRRRPMMTVAPCTASSATDNAT